MKDQPILREVLGSYKARLRIGDKDVICTSPTLATLGDYEQKFGPDRMITSGDKTLRPTTNELIEMLWGICKDSRPPWTDMGHMKEELRAPDLMAHLPDIISLFFGGSELEKSGSGSSSDSCVSESAPTTGPA